MSFFIYILTVQIFFPKNFFSVLRRVCGWSSQPMRFSNTWYGTVFNLLTFIRGGGKGGGLPSDSYKKKALNRGKHTVYTTGHQVSLPPFSIPSLMYAWYLKIVNWQ